MSEKASKGRIFNPEKFQNHCNEGKGKGKKQQGRGERKEERGEEKKAMVTLLVFIIATLEIAIERIKGPFGDYVFKNPARYKKEDKKGSPTYPLPPPQHTQTDMNGRFLNKFIQ